MDNELFTHDMKGFESVLTSICDTTRASVEETKEIISANLAVFEKILTQEVSPDEFLDFIGHGSFKEAYFPINRKGEFVLKFATEDNETSGELYICDEADSYGVGCFFIPTYYTWLKSAYPPAALIGEDSDSSYKWIDRTTYWTDSRGERHTTYTQVENPDWCNPVFNAVCAQPFATPFSDIGCTCRYIWGSDETEREFYYYENPLTINDTFVPFEVAKTLFYEMDVHEWWQLAINIYGIEKCLLLCDFLDEYDVSDLHSANVGTMIKDGREIPIIMDWLS